MSWDALESRDILSALNDLWPNSREITDLELQVFEDEFGRFSARKVVRALRLAKRRTTRASRPSFGEFKRYVRVICREEPPEPEKEPWEPTLTWPEYQAKVHSGEEAVDISAFSWVEKILERRTFRRSMDGPTKIGD